MQEANQHLANTLKGLREAKGWSLDHASKQTGVSKAMLGQIERMESSPTVATLWKIAGGFQVSLSNLLVPVLDEQQGASLGAGAVLPEQLQQGEMHVVTVFPFEPRFGFEVFQLTLPPGFERLSDPHESGVTEHLVVISGAMEVLINDEWTKLTCGGAVRFAADRPHGYRNVNQEPATFHNLIHYNRG